MKKTISLTECTKQVRHMGNLFGLLFYHFTKTLIEELGEKRGKELVSKAVFSYGTARGKIIRKKVLNAGLELTIKNFFNFHDLPQLGWESNKAGVTYCSYAEPWFEEGAKEIGKLYCDVDFAKVKAYNPKIKVTRTSTILEGNHCCKYTFDE